MLKEATFYKAIQDFNLSTDLYGFKRYQIYKNTLLFVTEVRPIDESQLFSVTLIIDYKEFKSIWHPERVEDFLIEIS